MKSLAFIVVGLTLGLLVAFVVFNSGLKVSFDKDASPTPNANASQDPTATPTPSVAPTETTVEAGGKESFSKYQIEFPAGWTSNKTAAYDSQDVLTLTSNGYKIEIRQDAFGGAGCSYSDKPINDNIPKGDYKYFKQMTTKDGSLIRRSGDSEDSLSFGVCEERQDVYQVPTLYGGIAVTFPANPTATKIAEVDAIISSLKKI